MQKLETTLPLKIEKQIENAPREQEAAGTTESIRWVVGSMLPMFAATWGGLVALLVKL